MTTVGVTLPRLRSAAASGFGVAQLRTFLASPLPDSALAVYLADAMADIARAAAPAVVSERLRARGDMLLLSTAAATVSAVVEDDRGAALELDAGDYELSGSGRILYRLRTGTTPSRSWRGWVSVRYRRVDDTAARIRVAVALVELDTAYRPGLAGERIGDYQAMYAHAGLASYADQRAALLASLDPGPEIR